MEILGKVVVRLNWVAKWVAPWKRLKITELSKFLLTGYQFSFSSVIVQIEYVVVLRGARLAVLQQDSRWRNKRQCISIGKCLGPRYGSRDSEVVVDGVPLYIQNILRWFVNIYRYVFKPPARNRDLKSMSFVHIVTSILVNDSFFFAQALFVSVIQILQFVHSILSVLPMYTDRTPF